MTCPRCGLTDVDTATCARCGVVLAKYRGPVERPRASRPPASPTSHNSVPLWLWLAVLSVALVVSLGVRSRLRTEPRAVTTEAEFRPSTGPLTSTEREDEPAAPPAPVQVAVPSVVRDELQQAAGLTDQDQQMAMALAVRLGQPTLLSEEHLRSAEALSARHPSEPALRTLVAAVHLRLAGQDQSARRYTTARAHVQQAALDATLAPQAIALLVSLASETSDWAGAEAAARRLLELKPGDVFGQRSLGYALFRQDRNREAEQALQALVDTRDDAEAKALLRRIHKVAGDEQGMTEQRLAHFNVRYDGSAHEDVGREILRALERHFATLTSTLDHSMATTVPVILFSDQNYYLANGMPAWAGGHFDTADGRIRIPIGGLGTSLSPELDGVLIHELTHAFVGDRSRGKAPREIHEGLAQYMEGKRLAQMLSAEELAALAQGRSQGVGGFYLEALGFVEYLMKLRGQGGLNDLLQAMGATGSVDAAFQQVYGHDFRATQAEWRQRFRQSEG